MVTFFHSSEENVEKKCPNLQRKKPETKRVCVLDWLSQP